MCGHIAKHYSHAAGDPILYWLIKDNEIPTECQIIPKPEIPDGCDECHYEIKGWKDNHRRKFFKRAQEESGLDMFRICADEGERTLVEGDIKSFRDTR